MWSPVEIRWDTGKFCINWLSKIVINILEGQTLQRWEEKEVRRSAAQKQQQAQAAKTAAAAKQAATGTKATRKAATSSRIRSSTNSTNNNPEIVRAKRCGARSGRGVFPRISVRLC